MKKSDLATTELPLKLQPLHSTPRTTASSTSERTVTEPRSPHQDSDADTTNDSSLLEKSRGKESPDIINFNTKSLEKSRQNISLDKMSQNDKEFVGDAFSNENMGPPLGPNILPPHSEQNVQTGGSHNTTPSHSQNTSRQTSRQTSNTSSHTEYHDLPEKNANGQDDVSKSIETAMSIALSDTVNTTDIFSNKRPIAHTSKDPRFLHQPNQPNSRIIRRIQEDSDSFSGQNSQIDQSTMSTTIGTTVPGFNNQNDHDYANYDPPPRSISHLPDDFLRVTIPNDHFTGNTANTNSQNVSSQIPSKSQNSENFHFSTPPKTTKSSENTCAECAHSCSAHDINIPNFSENGSSRARTSSTPKSSASKHISKRARHTPLSPILKRRNSENDRNPKRSKDLVDSEDDWIMCDADSDCQDMECENHDDNYPQVQNINSVKDALAAESDQNESDNGNLIVPRRPSRVKIKDSRGRSTSRSIAVRSRNRSNSSGNSMDSNFSGRSISPGVRRSLPNMKVPVFKGSISDSANQFICDVESFAEMYGLSSKTMVSFAINCCQELAKSWAYNLNRAQRKNWTTFKKLFLSTFAYTGDEWASIQKLTDIKLTPEMQVETYVHKILDAGNTTDHQAILKNLFAGLPEDICRDVQRFTPRSLRDFIRQVDLSRKSSMARKGINIAAISGLPKQGFGNNNKNYKGKNNGNNNSNNNNAGTYRNNNNNNQNVQGNANNNQSNNANFQGQTPQSGQEQSQGKVIFCYHCGGPNHTSRTCILKTNQLAQQGKGRGQNRRNNNNRNNQGNQQQQNFQNTGSSNNMGFNGTFQGQNQQNFGMPNMQNANFGAQGNFGNQGNNPNGNFGYGNFNGNAQNGNFQNFGNTGTFDNNFNQMAQQSYPQQFMQQYEPQKQFKKGSSRKANYGSNSDDEEMEHLN